MSAALLFLYILEHSSSIPFGVFIFHSYTESGKGQVASKSRPLFRGGISGKFPPKSSLVGVCRVLEISPKRDIKVVSKHISGSACGSIYL